MKLSKIQTSILFLILLIVVSFLYNYQKILFYPPFSVHYWRQSDCLSITLNYYQENLSFFTPKIHWTSPTGDNYTISEFPVIYYGVAQLWKVFGQKEFIFRLVNLLFVFAGLFSLFRLSLAYLKDNFWAIYIPLFLFTSPILVYYTNNFMADAPAFGLALSASYFYWKYYQKKKWTHLLAAILFISLAGLLKISSLILFTAFLSLSLIETIPQWIKKQLTTRQVLLKIFPFLIVLVIIGAWYIYARHFTKIHNSGIFLQSIYPIWELDAAKIHMILDSLYWQLLPAFFNKKVLTLTLLLGLSSLFISPKNNKWIINLYLISLFGIISFIILWFKAFDVHDYYLTNLLFIVPFSLLLFLGTLKSKFSKIFRHWSLKLIATTVLLFLVYQTMFINRIKYNAHDAWLSADLIEKKGSVDYFANKQKDYNETLKALEEITPYLREIGISRTDLVYSTPDYTINHTLYLMDQRGFTEYGYVPYKGVEKTNDRIEYFKQLGAKYLIVNADKYTKYIDEKYLSNCIGTFQNVKIYKIE
ncbi:MAG: ArnT family glycosyltransferase [Prolixibacteraceae bacterium]